MVFGISGEWLKSGEGEMRFKKDKPVEAMVLMRCYWIF